MRNHKLLFQTSSENHASESFIKVKENNGYAYAERAGIDSVAFILIDKKRPGELGLRHEYKPPIDMFLTGAFGGSLDDIMLTFDEIVQQEVIEEAGYKVPLDNIHFVGMMFVSTQMNQFCHLYVVDTTGIPYQGTQPQGKWESLEGVGTQWVKEKFIGSLEFNDWKAIVAYYNAKEKGII